MELRSGTTGANAESLENTDTTDSSVTQTRAPWTSPKVQVLPRLSELTLQSGTPVPGGGGPGGGGSTVIP